MARKRLVTRSARKASGVHDLRARTASDASDSLTPRYHYAWFQLEADKANKRSVSRKRLRADRMVRLRGKHAHVPLGRMLRRQGLFKLRANVYKTVDYNTFSKNGNLKLTEIELYFISSYITKATSCQWGLVYLGVGDGERFRALRDDYFPRLTVIAFDPLDSHFDTRRSHIEKTAERWNNDGSSFTFLLRCFDPETDVDWIKKQLDGRRLLLISDIRGINLDESGTAFDTDKDQDEQWKAIQALQPEKSLCKFTMPNLASQWYTYVPGVLLKQTFCYFGTAEARLLIDGVPEHSMDYNVWEVSEKLQRHHTHLRGKVYKSSFRPGVIGCRCLDSCFDCTVLWNTASMYAKKNSLDPYDVIKKILVEHGYDSSWSEANGTSWEDALCKLESGHLMEAVAVLDGNKDDERDAEWPAVMNRLWSQQPNLARKLSLLDGGTPSRGSLIHALGSLSVPFTLVKSELNGLLEYPNWSWNHLWQQYFAKQEASMKSKQALGLNTCWFFANGCCSYGDQCPRTHERGEHGGN